MRLADKAFRALNAGMIPALATYAASAGYGERCLFHSPITLSVMVLLSCALVYLVLDIGIERGEKR